MKKEVLFPNIRLVTIEVQLKLIKEGKVEDAVTIVGHRFKDPLVVDV